jgi:hypothetical protein
MQLPLSGNIEWDPKDCHNERMSNACIMEPKLELQK